LLNWIQFAIFVWFDMEIEDKDKLTSDN